MSMNLLTDAQVLAIALGVLVLVVGTIYAMTEDRKSGISVIRRGRKQ